MVQNNMVNFFLLRNIVIQQTYKYCFIQCPLWQTERNNLSCVVSAHKLAPAFIVLVLMLCSQTQLHLNQTLP